MDARSTSASRRRRSSSARRSCSGCSTESKPLYKFDDLGMPPIDARDLRRARAVAVRHGHLRGPDRQREDHDALRDARRARHERAQRDDDRGPGRVHPPDGQPDPDQRSRRGDVRRRTQVDPAPGPRRDPRRRDPRHRDRPDRGAVGAHRSLRALVAPRHRRGVGAPPVPRHGHRAVPRSRRRSSPSSGSASCGASATTAVRQYDPDCRRARVLPVDRRRREGPASSAARAATSAPAPATRSGSASTRSCA